MQTAKRKLSHIFALIFSVSILIGCTFIEPIQMAMTGNPVVKSEQSEKKGAELYANHCVQCHGESGLGDGQLASSLPQKPRDLTALGWKPDGLLAMRIQQGRGSMPAWKGVLSDQEIWLLVGHLRSLDKAP